LAILEANGVGKILDQYSMEDLKKPEEKCTKEEFFKNFKYLIDIAHRDLTKAALFGDQYHP
jgi:hypothetical protein